MSFTQKDASNTTVYFDSEGDGTSGAPHKPVLPTGAATSAKQDDLISALASLLTELQVKADPAEAQLVQASSLPLPTGAASSANQSTMITSLSSLVTLVTNLITELQAKADLTETQPVSVSGVSTASNQSTMITNQGTLITNLGATTDAEATTNGSVIGVLKRIRTYLTNIFQNIGATTDAAAVGDGTLIAITKQIRALLTGTLSFVQKNGNGDTISDVNPLEVRQAALVSDNDNVEARAFYYDGTNWKPVQAYKKIKNLLHAGLANNASFAVCGTGAPGAGLRYVLHHIVLTSDVAGEFQLYAGTTQIATIKQSANVQAEYPLYGVAGGDNESLTLKNVTSSTAVLRGYSIYTIEAV